MTLPAKRPTKALPAIYVVVDEDGELVSHQFYLTRDDTRDERGYPGDRAVKYAPVPTAPRRRSRK